MNAIVSIYQAAVLAMVVCIFGVVMARVFWGQRAEGTVRRCMIWSTGGIWHITSFPRDHVDHEEMRREALARKNTQLKRRRS